MRGVRQRFIVTGLAGFILALALAATAAAQQFVVEFGDPGADEPERLASAASSVAVDADGNPWVADLGASRIVKYDYNGGFVAEFTSFGDIPVKSPWGVAADDKGFLYIAQGSSEPRIAKIDTGGRLVRTIRLVQPDGVVLQPHKIAVDDSGRLYVSDGVDTVHVHSQNGKRHGQIRQPRGWRVRDVAVDDGEVFVVYNTEVPDQGGVAHYGSDLKLVNRLGPFGDVSLQEIAVDPAGRLNVADYRNSIVRRFDRATGEIDQFGRKGNGKGEMGGPQGIAIDCRGNVYVVDGSARYDGEGGPRAGSKVLKYEVDAEPPPCATRPLPAGAIDTQINDVEVTQGIQPPLSYTAGPQLAPGEMAFELAERQPRMRAYGSSTGGASSGEVPLKAALKTVVRVYANLKLGPPGGIANVPATLEAVTKSGKRLGPIQPVAKPALLRNGSRTVEGAQRTDPVGPYSFELPDAWTRKGPIELIARVNPAGIGCEGQCRNRSTFHLTDVPFETIRVAPIAPIALTSYGQVATKDLEEVFRPSQRTTPLLLDVSGFQAVAEVGDLLNAESVRVESCFVGIWPCESDTYRRGQPEFRTYLQGELMDRLERAANERGLLRCDRVPIGLAAGNQNLPGSMRGELLARGFFPCARGYATVDRPLRSVAHELQHAFGRPHAGQSCDGTREGEDQEGERWPPDDRGLLSGIGLDTTLRGRSVRGPYDVIAPGTGSRPEELFDLMSYCASGEDSVWISPRGWRNLSNWRVNRVARRGASRRAGSRERLLRVSAMELADGNLGITGISPTRVAEPNGDPESPYVLEALDEDAAVLASVRVDADELSHTDGKMLTGTVPAPPGTTQVFLRRGDEAGARRVASPNAPKVKLLAPRAGTRASGRAVKVRWRAGDRDGGPLTATVELSINDGKSWQGMHVGPASGEVAIPRAMLAGSKRARVRVRIDDGFHEAVATSKRFTLVAPTPRARIVDPAGAVTVRADAALGLRGEAVGAWGRSLKAKQLRWFDGRRGIGRGKSVSVAGLRAGKHRITLAASQGGRTGRSSLLVKVRPVKPAFLRLDAPAKLSRRARSIRLRVASTVPAKLSVAGKRFRVAPRVRRVKVPIKRGRSKLRLGLKLKSGRRATRQAISIERR